MCRRVLPLLALLAASTARAEDAAAPAPASEEGAPAAARERGEAEPEPRSPRTSWFAVPGVFDTPETGFGFGAIAGVYRPLEAGLRSSSLSLSAAYTLRHHALLDLELQLVTRRGLVALTVEAERFPEKFFGVGRESARSAEEDFTPRYVDVVLSPARRWSSGLHAGPTFHVRAEELTRAERGGRIAAGEIPGTEPYLALGVGPSVAWDTRDSVFQPRRGGYAAARLLVYPRGAVRGVLARWTLDLRHFRRITAGHVLATNASFSGTHGDAPMTLLPKLGSAHLLRGYLEGRWRDRLAWSAQAEYRLPIVWRFGGVIFGGMGDVARRFSNLAGTTPRLAGGGGLRLRVNDEGVNLRADFAWGAEGRAFYFLGMDAF
jgi:hypothetical protein